MNLRQGEHVGDGLPCARNERGSAFGCTRSPTGLGGTRRYLAVLGGSGVNASVQMLAQRWLHCQCPTFFFFFPFLRFIKPRVLGRAVCRLICICGKLASTHGRRKIITGVIKYKYINTPRGRLNSGLSSRRCTKRCEVNSSTRKKYIYTCAFFQHTHGGYCMCTHTFTTHTHTQEDANELYLAERKKLVC